jgi:hypothetical protein
MIGQSLAHYRVAAALGAGDMARSTAPGSGR